MRKVVLLGIVILLLAPACVSPRIVLPSIPIIGRVVVGGSPPPDPTPPNPQPPQCEEISRIPCDIVHCESPDYDFVTVKCTGKAASGKCEPNGGCTKKK